ncbi:ABC-type Fe3+ transport system, periplasmic component [Opitutaceae bacterium TAV1]|nr:ABC-type Fe3+ transport system, periplasmic component [Opitutaceae bacterium TAV1]
MKTRLAVLRPFRSVLAFAAPLLALAALFSGAASAARAAGEVNLYSHRHYEIDKEIFAGFTKRTGITVNVVQASADQLIERLRSEGDNSPADLLMTVDAGRLQRAKAAGLLRPATSPVLAAQVPAHLRDPDNQWHAVTVRARVIIYAKDRVKPAELSTYEALADPKWKGRLLVTSSRTVYNQSLLASIIAADGRDAALAWARGINANLARSPQGGDRDQARAIAAGLADVAITNTYYIGLLRTSKDARDRQAGEAVEVFFPNQDGRGAHINVSAAGLTRSAKNPDNAIKLLEYLTSPEVQARFATANHEYPLSLDINASPVLRAFGPFKADERAVPQFGELNATAVELFNAAGWQ